MPALAAGPPGATLLHERAVGDGQVTSFSDLVDGQRVDPQVAAVDAPGLLELRG